MSKGNRDQKNCEYKNCGRDLVKAKRDGILRIHAMYCTPSHKVLEWNRTHQDKEVKGK